MSKMLPLFLTFMSFSLPVLGNIDFTVLPEMDAIYGQKFEKKVNRAQAETQKYATANKDKKLRVMTYNMLYNAEEAENKLPIKHRWNQRKNRLKEYLLFVKADVISSQELQEDQVKDVREFLSPEYDYYGVKTRENEGRTDVNAIFFKKERLELLDAKTCFYVHDVYANAFTFCYFRDKLLDQNFIVINTKLTFDDPERRIQEAFQLNYFSQELSSDIPLIITGDFNTFPFIQDSRNLFFDGEEVIKALEGQHLKDARARSIYGHFGPLCSITNSKETLEPFVGAQLPGFILDHLFVNDWIEVFTHGIDSAKVEGEFPSDHLPVIADIYIRESSK